jgi:hypothetical protein
MDEIECLVRAAMAGALEQAPAGLLARVYRQLRRHRRRALAGYLAGAAALVVAIPLAGHELGGREPPSGPAPGSSSTPGPANASLPASVAAPGTLLLTCNDANWGQLQPNWRAASLHAGPLWFVGGRHDGYVHTRSFRPTGHSSQTHRNGSGDVMIVEVADGSTVTMKPEREAQAYFRFFDGFNGPRPNDLPAGDTGFTFSACPRGHAGPNGPVTDFYLGFSIKAGRAAPVDISTRASVPPIRVFFTGGRP